MLAKPRVLVIDDDQDTAKAMELALEHDYAVDAVLSPIEALERVARIDYDVVLTDLVMEGMGGIELSARVLEARPETPVIVVTGNGSLQSAIEAMRIGAYDFVTKPVDVGLLGVAVARAIQKRNLRSEVRRLERTIEQGPTIARDIIGSSPQATRIRELVSLVARTDASVLLQGETGTGKEVVARALHETSGVAGPFVALNCAAVPHNLIESELFGHARGAFTDARAERAGLFVQANGGTIFLDEIAELPRETQPKLLRALQERKVRPVGSNVEVPFSARLISATNRDLEEEVHARRFREDLYYRINVMRIDLPPLRERGRDVIELAAHFLAQIAAKTGKAPLRISATVAARLLAYDWPGNARELENCVQRMVVFARGDELSAADLPEKIRRQAPRDVVAAPQDGASIVPMAEVERQYILRVLDAVGGNKVRAAQMLGLNRKTLYRKLRKFRGSN